MAKYKVSYIKTSKRIMVVEANNEEEAKRKYEEFDCLDDCEAEGINEELEEINIMKS